MNPAESLGIIVTIIAAILVPTVAYWVTERLCKLKKLSSVQRVSMYASVIFASFASWSLAQLYIPLGIVGLIAIPFFTALLVAKLSAKRSAQVAALFVLLFFLLQLAVSFVLYNLSHF